MENGLSTLLTLVLQVWWGWTFLDNQRRQHNQTIPLILALQSPASAR